MSLARAGHEMQELFLNPKAEYPYDHPRFRGDERKTKDRYPSGNEYGGDADSDGKLTYFEAHPEWYGLRNGKRSGRLDGAGDNYCTSNKYATKELAKNLVLNLIGGAWRNVDIANLWMLDNGKWCECAKCVQQGIYTDRLFDVCYAVQKEEFSVLSPNEIRKMSATKVITADTYDDDGFPITMGLMDQRLSVIEPGLRCKTRGLKVRKDKCPGHFGHIDLAIPVIHVGFVKTIRNCLRATCRKCGRILLTDKELEEHRKNITKNNSEGRDNAYIFKTIISSATKTEGCPRCGAQSGKIDLDKPTSFRENGKKLTPTEIREWLEKIPDEDLPLLDINVLSARPEWMVLTVLPVPPVTVRPSVTLESGERSEDDLDKAQMVGRVSPEMLVGQEHYLVPVCEGPFECLRRVGGGADRSAMKPGERFDARVRVHVCNGNDFTRIADGLVQLCPAPHNIRFDGHIGHGTSGAQVGMVHLLMGLRNDLGALGHEMYSAEDDIGRLVEQARLSGQGIRIAGKVPDGDDLLALIMMRQNHEPLAIVVFEILMG